MSVWTYEQYRTRQQEIELKALIALAEFGHKFQRSKACDKLCEIAFLYENEQLRKLRQETLEDLK
jgi:hypothetical protein